MHGLRKVRPKVDAWAKKDREVDAWTKKVKPKVDDALRKLDRKWMHGRVKANPEVGVWTEEG